MRFMTREAGKSAVAVAEARGAVQIRGLVPHVPGIGPVAVVVQIACLAMAGAAKRIDLHGRQRLRILDRSSTAGFGVRATGSVAAFATHSQLSWLDLKLFAERDRARRVAAEAAQCGGDRVKSAVYE